MTMHEPDWTRLPWRTTSTDWRAYVETATAAEALAWLEGQPTAQPAVWLELAAVSAFASACAIDEARAHIELGAGVLRWWRAGGCAIHEGECYASVRFRGCPALQLSVGRRDGCLLVHLPREVPS